MDTAYATSALQRTPAIVPGVQPIPREPQSGFTGSLVAIVSPDELARAEQAKLDAEEAARKASETVLTSLAAYVDTCFEAAERARQTIEQRIIDSRKQVKGVYRSDVLAEINKFGGSKTFIQHTGNKCSAAMSWIQDIVLPPDEFPASVESTPIPDLPEDIIQNIVDVVTAKFQALAQQTGVPPDPQDVIDLASKLREEKLELLRADAERRAKGMERKILDQLAEANFTDCLLDVLTNLVQTPGGILKGPMVRRKKMLVWGVDPKTGKRRPEVSERLTFELSAVDPLDFYPSPNCTNVNDGYCLQRVRSTRKNLQEMKGVDGYNDAEIDAVLAEYGTGGLQEQKAPDSDRAELENRDNTTGIGNGYGDPTIEGREFWGSVQGKLLQDWGMEIDDADLTKEFDIRAEKYGKHVVCAVLNPDPLGRKPYYIAAFQEESGSVWGKGLPELISDIQDILNGCVRHLQNNLAICSGPQVGIDLSKLAPGCDWQNFHPWKVWAFESTIGTTPPITFFQPPCNIQELIAVYEKFDGISDDITVPKYSYGNQQVVGAAATASGLSMLMNAANKRIKKVIASIDRRILRPMIERFYVYNMLYDEDESIKGDVQIVPRGAMALVVKEQLQLRRQEFMNATANQVDMQIIGIRGRARLLREIAKSLAIPESQLVPTEDEINQQIAQAAAQAAAAAQASAVQAQNAGNSAAPKSRPVAGEAPATAQTAPVAGAVPTPA